MTTKTCEHGRDAGGVRPAVSGTQKIVVTAVQAGHWISAGPSAPPSLPSETSPPPGTVFVGVGTPGGTAPDGAQLADAVAALVPVTREDLLLAAPWSAPAELGELAGAVATRLGRPVRATGGLPVRTEDARSYRVLDEHGSPTWEPWLLELTAAPGRQPVASAVRPTGCAVPPGWEVEAVPAGVWLRRSDLPSSGGSPRLRPADPRRPLLIVGERGRPVPEVVWAGLGSLLAELREAGTPAPGLLVAGAPGPATESSARLVARRYGLAWCGFDHPTALDPAGARTGLHGLLRTIRHR